MKGEADGSGRLPEPSPDLSRTLSGEHDNWLYFASASGKPGRRWVEAFRSSRGFSLLSLTSQALPFFHRRDFEQGRRLLAEAESLLHSICDVPSSFVLILESIYHPLLAYDHYCRGEGERARQELDRGEAALTAALQLEPFLLPQAFRCLELELHRARIARNDRRWCDLHHHVEKASAMLHGRQPFCVLPGGNEVTLADVQDFLRTLPGLDPEKEEILRFWNDTSARLRLFDRFVLGIYAIPGFVIPSP